MRILAGGGQWELDDDRVDELNKLDAVVESAVEADDDEALAAGLDALLEFVRTSGQPLADDALVSSDAVLPPSDATVEEVRELLSEDGLIPD